MPRGAIVLGSGRSAWTDLRALGPREAPVFAVNDMIVFAPAIEHAVSHHAEKLQHWNALRTRASARRPRESGITVHSSAAGPGIDKVWLKLRGDGSSALLAVRIALALGYQPVTVCGVPLDAGGYLWSDPYTDDPVYDFARYRAAWERAEPEFKGRVTAVSGWLSGLFGAVPA
jgi:hypothetical protein